MVLLSDNIMACVTQYTQKETNLQKKKYPFSVLFLIVEH